MKFGCHVIRSRSQWMMITLRTRRSSWWTTGMRGWSVLSKTGWSPRSWQTVPAQSTWSQNVTKWCRQVLAFTLASLPTTRSMGWRRFWLSRSRVTLEFHVPGGMVLQLMRSRIRSSSLSHGLCWGIPRHPTSTWRSTMAMSSCSTGSSGATGLTRIWRSNNSSWMRSWSGPPMWAHRSYRAWWLCSKVGESQFWLSNVVVGPTLQLPMATWSQVTSLARGGSWGCVHAPLRMLLGMMQIASNLGSEMPTTELTWRRLEPRFQQHGSQWATSLGPTWSLLYRQFAVEELEWKGQNRLNSSVSWLLSTRIGGPTQWQVCQLRWGQRWSSSELLMPATSTSRALQGSTLRSQRSCLQSLWPLCTMIGRWRLRLLKDLQLLLRKPGSRLPKIAEEIVIKPEKMRRGSKTEQVASSTPGLWTGSMWQMFMREFVDMWWIKAEMRQGKIAATRDLRPTSRLRCSLTSSAGGGSMRRRLVLKRSRRKKLSQSRSRIFLLQQVLPSMSRFSLQRIQLKVLQHLLVHHSRSDRREALRRPIADDPAWGGSLSEGRRLLVWPEIGSDHLPRSSGLSIDSEKGRSAQLRPFASPLFTHPLGGPRGRLVFRSFGVPRFRDWFMRVHAKGCCSGSIGRSSCGRYEISWDLSFVIIFFNRMIVDRISMDLFLSFRSGMGRLEHWTCDRLGFFM